MVVSPKDTYCPLLWSDVFIDPKGDVFSCCHRKPAVIGNIHNEKLENIYNNPVIQKLRHDSLTGKLQCFENCTLLDKEKIRKSPRKTAFDYDKDLKKLKIEFGELCNINCVMCWQDHKSKTVLNHQTLVENVGLKPFRIVDIQGGEPMAIADAKAFYDHVSSQKKDPLIMTNGLLINDEWAKKIALNSSYIYISLNAATVKTHELVNKGSKWHVVLRNIQRLKDARDRLGTSLKIIGHMTIVLENLQEISSFIEHFEEFGFDQIDFGYDKKVPGYLAGQPFLKISLMRDIHKAYKMSKAPFSIDLKRLKMLGLVK